MRRLRFAAACALSSSLIIGGAAGTTTIHALSGEPPDSGTPAWQVLAYGYYCDNGTTNCTASGGGLHYMHVAAFGHDTQRSGLVDPTGYSIECGQFMPIGGGSSTYRHEWVAANSYPRASMQSPQPKLNGAVPTSIGSDSVNNPPRVAPGVVSGSTLTDPLSSDSASVAGVQIANDDFHTLLAGAWHVTMNGTIWGGSPNDHGFHVLGSGAMTCTATHGLFAYTGTDTPSGSPYPGYTVESAFEPFEGGSELNYPASHS